MGPILSLKGTLQHICDFHDDMRSVYMCQEETLFLRHCFWYNHFLNYLIKYNINYILKLDLKV
jgi:hypothetical protein